MASPRDFVRQAVPCGKISHDLRYPAMVDAVREMLEEMAYTRNGVVTMRQMWEYLQTPEDEGGMGLVPGETMTDTYTHFRNYIHHRQTELWNARGGKLAGQERPNV